jgi:negative regulator of sigma E activity
MVQSVEEQLSAFLDGELPAEELELLLARLDREPARRAKLARYAMIGECIRSGSASIEALTLVERVRVALMEDDATAAAPAPASSGLHVPRRWLAAGAAAAIAAAAALIVMNSAAPPGDAPDGAAPVVIAEQQPPAPARAAAEEPLADITPNANHRLSPRAAARLTEYLVAHGQYTNPLSRSNFDSHLVSARAERASWRQYQDAGNVR